RVREALDDHALDPRPPHVGEDMEARSPDRAVAQARPDHAHPVAEPHAPGRDAHLDGEALASGRQDDGVRALRDDRSFDCLRRCARRSDGEQEGRYRKQSCPFHRLTPLGYWATAPVLAVPTEEEAFGAEKSRSGYQPWPEVPPPSRPLEPEPSEPEPSEPEDVVVVVVVEAEPLPGPELDPEEPPSEEPWPEPSW